jgi:hypothetical protein
MKSYPRILEAEVLTHKAVGTPERFDRAENRLFYYLMPYQGRTVWKRTGQGDYNWRLSQGYTVSYIDNAKPEED